jgi:hypothetical protein
MTKIELSDDEAKMFTEYMRHRDFLDALLMARIQDIRLGKAELHFSDGRLMEVHSSTVAYRRRA